MLFTIRFQFDNCGLPKLVVLLPETIELSHDGIVQMRKESFRLSQLLLLGLYKRISQNSRLLLNVLYV